MVTKQSEVSAKATCLKFKNKSSLKKQKKREHRKQIRVEGSNPAEAENEIVPGVGRIIAQGQTIQGFKTEFRTQIKVGDIICIFHPSTHVPEKRTVQHIATDRTLHIQPPFSSDFVSTTEFTIEKTPSAPIPENEEPVPDTLSKEIQKRIKKQSKMFSVREKTGMWGYKVVTSKHKGELTAEERLDQRCKQGRDKFCW